MVSDKQLKYINTPKTKTTDMRLYHYLLAMISLAFLVSACDSSSSTSAVDPDEPTILDIAVADDNFSILVGALVDANLDGALDGAGPFTVFAPTNDAFEALPEGLLESLTTEQLSEILTYHVLEAEVGSGALQPEQIVGTLNGDDLFIEAEGMNVTLNGNASVTTADVLAANGVIHVIDTVLLPDAYGNVVENAQKRFFLSALVDAVVTADLAGVLSSPDAEFTVFAPTNDAFAAIEDVVAGLSIEELTEVLLYHVVDARALSGDLQDGQTITTLGGQDLTVGIADGVVTINGSAVVTSADNDGTNGVIHVIDTVLIPGGEETAVDGTITINNVGASAWVVESIEGEGISADIGVENATITLQEGLRYEIVNLGTGNHPLQLRDGSAEVLVAEAGDGSLQDYEPANVVVDEENGIITFTLTGNLADWVATYNCAPHASMEGDIIVTSPVL